MALPLTIDAVTYDYPEQGDVGYATQATDWAQAATNAIATAETNITTLQSAVTAIQSKVYAECTTAAGATMGATAYTIINYATVVKDTGSDVTTGASWKFTAPTTGQYAVSASCRFAALTANTAVLTIAVFKNGALVCYGAVTDASNGATQGYAVSTIVDCTASDYIDVRAYNGQGSGRALTATATDNRITIKQLE